MASEELGVSQPSISYSIKQLEKELNVQLFYRDNKKIIPLENYKKGFILIRIDVHVLIIKL